MIDNSEFTIVLDSNDSKKRRIFKKIILKYLIKKIIKNLKKKFII